MNYPKYSILLPIYNGMPYLKFCIQSIIEQDYFDYELIVSDDHSTDGSSEYLCGLNHPNVLILGPKEKLSMTEHWDWLLSHAKGEWRIFVGQDDGLQPYFFDLADKLIEIAEENKIRSIMSSRAYFFWQGCEPVYGDTAMSYFAMPKVKILSSFKESLKALFGFQNYFELPEMYTTSLFHKNLIEEARNLQNGKVLVTHPQDANLGVISASLETKYLKSFIPLGWVGSSVKSAGMAVSADTKLFNSEVSNSIFNLKVEYSNKINNSLLVYNKLAGNFLFGDLSIYFWQSFLQTSSLRSTKLNKFFVSSIFKLFFFSSVQSRLLLSKNKKQIEFKEILAINSLNYILINLISFSILFFLPVYSITFFFFRVFKRAYDEIFNIRIFKVVSRSNNPCFNIDDASRLSNFFYNSFGDFKLK